MSYYNGQKIEDEFPEKQESKPSVIIGVGNPVEKERVFTLQEMMDAWDKGMICGGAGHLPSDSCKKKYFKTKFDINIKD